MTKSELATRIQRRIQDLPVSKNSHTSALKNFLNHKLLEDIADAAADEAMVAMSEKK